MNSEEDLKDDENQEKDENTLNPKTNVVFYFNA